MNHIKKLLAILLCLCLMASLCTFAFAEGEEEESIFVTSETQLTVGTNRLSLTDNTKITVFEFVSTQSGIYRFTLTGSSAKLYTVDGSTFYMFNPVEQTTKKFEKEIKDSYVGAPMLVGVMARGNVSVKIERIGDASFDVAAQPYETYEPTATLKKFTKPAGMALTYVDVTKPHTAVPDSEGNYRLDSVNGPVLYIDLANAPYVPIAAAASNGNMKVILYKPDGSFDKKIEFITCINKYYGYLDNSTNTSVPGYTDGGIYPLTYDMIYIMQTYSDFSGWNDYDSPNYLFKTESANETESAIKTPVDKDTAWMFPVCYDANDLLGGKNNPHQVNGNTEITVPAGGTAHLSVLDQDGLIMKVTGADGFSVNDKADSNGTYQTEIDGNKVDCTLKNNTSADQTYAINFNIPLGAPSNPETITQPGVYNAPLNGNADGYSYSYTADFEGYVEISSAALYAINGTISQTDPTRVDVMPGDTVKITIYGNAATAWSLTTHTHVWADASCLTPKTCACGATKGEPAPHDFVSGNGICYGVNLAENEECGLDIRILLMEDNNHIEVPAGATNYYYGNFGGKNATLIGDNVTVAHNGNTYPVSGSVIFPAVGNPFNPSVFAVTNTGTEKGEYDLNFAFANGSKDAPVLLTEGGAYTTEFTGEAIDYFYNYTAAADGTLTVTMTGNNWQYVINNNTAGKYGDTHWCDDDPPVPGESVEMQAGDVIEIMIAFYDPTMSNPPAPVDWRLDIHTHNWSAETCAADTTCSDCDVTKPAPPHNYQNGVCATCGHSIQIRLLETENEITVPAGETNYYIGLYQGMFATLIGENVTISHDGQTHDVAGSVTFTVAGDPTDTRTPCVFAVTNNGDAEATYQLNFVHPEGTKGNPEEMPKDGEYSVELKEGNGGYYYSYTAKENGTVKVTMLTKDKWQYLVNNIDSSYYGDTHVYSDDPAVTEEEVTVKKGDLVEIMVSTADAANPWSAPAGTIKISVAFTKAAENDNDHDTPVGGGGEGTPQPDGEKPDDSKPEGGVDKPADKPDSDKPENDKEDTAPNAPTDGEDEGGKEEPKPQLGIDLDGDGASDMLLEDNMLIETDDGMGIDLNGDGVVDAMVLDLNNDGIWDGVDIDYDGVVDMQIIQIVTETPNAPQNGGSDYGSDNTSPVTGEATSALPYILLTMAAAVLFGTTLRKKMRG